MPAGRTIAGPESRPPAFSGATLMPEPMSQPATANATPSPGNLMESTKPVTQIGDHTSVAAPTAPVLSERYVLGDPIARGGMGAVYRATDTALGREVALKVLREHFAPDSSVARRFADEARIAAQLQHPGIPPVHDLGTLPDGRPFLAMKLIKGSTLEAILKQRPDPSADR